MSTDPRRFLYRPDGLDPDAALRLTADALKGCDDGELYLQYTASESFGFDDGRLKTADFNTQAGFGLRGVSGETTAFAHANELSEGAIRRAGETMSLLEGGASTTICTLSRTSGRTSCATKPSARTMSITLHEPASETVTCLTRGSRARAAASIAWHSSTLRAKGTRLSGSESV